MADTDKKMVDSPADQSIRFLGMDLKLNYIIFYWLGIGTLLPWNMFITVS